MSPLLAAFPSRPLRLAKSGPPRSGRWFGFKVAGVFLLLAVIAGYFLYREYRLRWDLAERGVAVVATYTDSHCSHPPRAPYNRYVCTAMAHYRLALAQGGAARETKVVADDFVRFGYDEVPIVYDPDDPDRLLPRTEVTRRPPDTFFVLTGLPLALALLFGSVMGMTVIDLRLAQTAVGRPILLPLTDMTRSARGQIGLFFNNPRSGRRSGFFLAAGLQPLLEISGTGKAVGDLSLVALQTKRRLYPIDEAARILDLTDAERRSIIERSLSLARERADRAAARSAAKGLSGGILDAFPARPLRLAEPALPPKPVAAAIVAAIGLGLAAYPTIMAVADVVQNGLRLPMHLNSQIKYTPWVGYLMLAALPLMLGVLGARAVVLLPRERRRAKQVEGDPVLIPVHNISRDEFGSTVIYYHHPVSGTWAFAPFTHGRDPFLVGAPLARGPGSSYLGALMTADGALYPLDAKLTYLDMTDDERRAVRERAGFD